MPWGRGPWSRTEPPRGREPEPPAAPSPAQLWAARRAWQQAPAMTDRVLRQWWGNMRMRWNCHSTAIEGSPLSYQDTLDVLVHAQAPQGQPPLLDIDQIRGHDAAAQQLAHMLTRGRTCSWPICTRSIGPCWSDPILPARLNQGQDLQLADLHGSIPCVTRGRTGAARGPRRGQGAVRSFQGGAQRPHQSRHRRGIRGSGASTAADDNLVGQPYPAS